MLSLMSVFLCNQQCKAPLTQIIQQYNITCKHPVEHTCIHVAADDSHIYGYVASS
jgi:hypothetical protein